MKNKVLVQIDKTHLEALEFYRENKETVTPTMVAKLFNLDKGKLLRCVREGIYYAEETGNCFLQNESLESYQLIIEEFFKEKDSFIKIGDLDNFCERHFTKQNVFTKNFKLLSSYDIDSFLDTINKTYTVKFNRDVFMSIDNEASAYWLGFILADGSIFRNELRLKLGKRDKVHLEKYCNFLNLSTDGIKEDTVEHSSYKNGPVTCYKVTVSDKHLIERLKGYNILPKKSMYEVPFKEINSSLLRHYIRGIFDGDGCIQASFTKVNLVGSYEVVSWVNEVFVKNLGVKAAKIVQKGKIYSITYYNKVDKQKILEWIYKDSTVYLDRKFSLYEEFSRL